MWLYKSTKVLVIILIFNHHLINCDTSSSASDSKLLEKLSTKCIEENNNEACLQEKALKGLINADHVEFAPGFSLDRKISDNDRRQSKEIPIEDEDANKYIINRVEEYLHSHVLNINLGRALEGWQSAVGYSQDRAEPRSGRNTFLTGFGLGFLAFGLKKLLLPVIIGAQVVKSILLAMFLPTILSGIGKFLGKSGASVFGASSGPSDDFDFKDNYDPSAYDAAASTNTATFTYPQSPQNRFETALDNSPSNYYTSESNKYPSNSQYALTSLYKTPIAGSPYRRPQTSATALLSGLKANHDYKTFHNIPTSSLLLTNYDPFYSPLLSRLDSIFKQMGYEQGDEACREKLVCNMYKSPAKYAPFSNLVSAQLSRELNELQKPTSGNPHILRFFRYMKAAKDGQDGNDCDTVYTTCRARELQSSGGKAGEGGILSAASPPMVKTYNEINKLVQARRLAKQLAESEVSSTSA